MKTLLPDIGASYCQYLTACAFIGEPSAEMLGWVRELPEKKRYQIAGYNTRHHQRAYVRLLLGEAKKGGIHVHVDLSTQEAFDKPPETTHRRRDIESALSHLEGAGADVTVNAHLTALLEGIDQNRSLARAFSIGADDQGIGISVTGVELEFKRAPVRKLRWRIRGAHFSSSMALRPVTEKIDKTYLKRIMENTEAIFARLALGREKPDVTRE